MEGLDLVFNEGKGWWFPIRFSTQHGQNESGMEGEMASVWPRLEKRAGGKVAYGDRPVE